MNIMIFIFSFFTLCCAFDSHTMVCDPEDGNLHQGGLYYAGRRLGLAPPPYLGGKGCPIQKEEYDNAVMAWPLLVEVAEGRISLTGPYNVAGIIPKNPEQNYDFSTVPSTGVDLDFVRLEHMSLERMKWCIIRAIGMDIQNVTWDNCDMVALYMYKCSVDNLVLKGGDYTNGLFVGIDFTKIIINGSPCFKGVRLLRCTVPSALKMLFEDQQVVMEDCVFIKEKDKA